MTAASIRRRIEKLERTSSPMPRLDDLVWLAGVIDKSGNFSYSLLTNKSGRTTRNYYSPRFIFSDIDLDFVKVVRELVGSGYIVKQRRSHRLVCADSACVHFARMILPFLRRKYQRMRVELIIKHSADDPVRNEELYQSMLALRHNEG